MNGVERKKVVPYELSDAALEVNVMDDKRRVKVGVEVRDVKSTYIPPPL